MHHEIPKEEAKRRRVGVGADGAAVNMGANAGLKALVTKNAGDKGTKPNLEYLGWFWVIFIHCVNHLMELGLQDLKHEEPYINEFDAILMKLFICTIIHLS